MYAIIKSGGKQTKVSPGDIIEVELLHTEDSSVTFTPILVVDGDGATITDKDSLAKASVTAKVIADVKGPKIKYKNKTGYRRRMGHRQKYTSLEVTGIDLPGSKKKAAAKKPAAKKPAAKKPAAKKTAPPKADTSTKSEAAASEEE